MQWLQERDGLHSLGINFTITVPPAYGVLMLNGQSLLSGTFTLKDLQSNSLLYQHDGSEEHSDVIHFHVEATTVERTELRIHPPNMIGGTLSISISPVNNHEPVVNAVNDISPLEGKFQIIDTSVLNITDEDRPGDDINIQVERTRFDNGYFALTYNTTQVITTFTMAQVLNGSVIFLHKFGDVLERVYILTISDGVHLFKKVRIQMLTNPVLWCPYTHKHLYIYHCQVSLAVLTSY